MGRDSSIAYARKNDHNGRCFHTCRKEAPLYKIAAPPLHRQCARRDAFARRQRAPVECTLATTRHHAARRIITVTYLVAPLLAHLAGLGDHVVPRPLGLPRADAAR